jgi:hypothetical protein
LSAIYSRRGGVRELAWLAHPNNATKRMLAVLVAFLDESGIHDPTGKEPGSQVAGFGGALAPTETWDEIEARWLDVLKRWQVPFFHMTDCLYQKKGFAGWSREQAEGLTQEMFDIITDYQMLRVCGTVSVQDYDRLIDTALKESLKHPYYFCLTLCMRQIIDWLPADFSEKVAFVCDRHSEFAPHAYSNFELLRTQMERPELLGSLTFDCKQDRIPLQVADPIVYTLTRYLRRKIYEPEKPLERWSAALLKDQYNLGRHFFSHNISTYVSAVLAETAALGQAKWNP